MAASQEEQFRPAAFSLPATTGTLWVPLLPCVLGKSSKISFLHYPKERQQLQTLAALLALLQNTRR